MNHEQCGVTPEVLAAQEAERRRRALDPVIQMGDPRSVLTEAEIDELRDLAMRHKEAYIAKNYGVSDELRAELMEWGAWPPEKGWYPVTESPAHRQARLAKRRVG